MADILCAYTHTKSKQQQHLFPFSGGKALGTCSEELILRSQDFWQQKLTNKCNIFLSNLVPTETIFLNTHKGNDLLCCGMQNLPTPPTFIEQALFSCILTHNAAAPFSLTFLSSMWLSHSAQGIMPGIQRTVKLVPFNSFIYIASLPGNMKQNTP